MPTNPSKNIHYAIAAYDLQRDNLLLFRTATTVGELQKLLDIALHRNATVIIIRRIHQPPASNTPKETRPDGRPRPQRHQHSPA